MEVTFRRAERRDLPAIVRLLADDPLGKDRERASDGDDVEDSYSRGFQAICDDPRQLLVVAVVGERVVGTLQLSFIRTSPTRAASERRSRRSASMPASVDVGWGVRWSSGASKRRAGVGATCCSSRRTGNGPTRVASTSPSARGDP